jgi:hypothetical protein
MITIVDMLMTFLRDFDENPEEQVDSIANAYE